MLAMAGLVGCMPTPTLTPAPTLTPVPTLTPTPTPMSTPTRPVEAAWQRLDTTGGGSQTGIAVHPTNPDVVYMVSDNGGVFKTENGGDRWFSVSSNLGAYRLGSVALDPLNAEVVYVTASTDYGSLTEGGATGEIYRSLNGGQSWEFISDDMGFQSSFPNQAAIVIPPGFDRDGDQLSDVVVVGAWTGPANPPVGGIWRSTDEGETFEHLALEGSNVVALRGFAGDANVLFVATYEGEVYRSGDLGETWAEITGNMPLAHPSDLVVHPGDPNTLYITCRFDCGAEPVWKTLDGGQHWESASAGLDTDEIGRFPMILIDRFDPDRLYLTTDKASKSKGGVYRSTDGGQSWQVMPYGLVLPDGRPYFWYQFEGEFAIGQAVNGRLFAGDEGAWRYPKGDGLEEWEPAAIGIGNVHVNTIEVDPLNPTVLYQGISDRGPYKSVDRGSTFHRILGNGWPVTVDNYVWNGPYFTNYEECELPCSSTCGATGRVAAGGTTDFAISRQDSNVVYSVFGGGAGKQRDLGGVNKSTDGGATWQPVGFQLEGGFEMNPETCVPYGFRHLAIDPTDDDVVFAAQENPVSETGKLYRTTDGGATWAEVYAASGYISEVAVSPVDPGLVVFTTRWGVYKSEQGGEAGSWQRVTPSGARRIQVVALSPHDAGVFVIGTTHDGIYYTADGGLSWENHPLEGLFEQRLCQGCDEYLEAEMATAFNPGEYMRRNIFAIAFDPVAVGTFYVAGTQHARASFGVARVTQAGQAWERLPLAGLSHRNVYDLAVDSAGGFLYAGTFDGTFRLRLR